MLEWYIIGFLILLLVIAAVAVSQGNLREHFHAEKVLQSAQINNLQEDQRSFKSYVSASIENGKAELNDLSEFRAKQLGFNQKLSKQTNMNTQQFAELKQYTDSLAKDQLELRSNFNVALKDQNRLTQIGLQELKNLAEFKEQQLGFNKKLCKRTIEIAQEQSAKMDQLVESLDEFKNKQIRYKNKMAKQIDSKGRAIDALKLDVANIPKGLFGGLGKSVDGIVSNIPLIQKFVNNPPLATKDK